jgi:taurine dioxygenase
MSMAIGEMSSARDSRSEDPAYRHIQVQRLTRACGGEIHGVDLSRPLTREVFDEIHRALLETHVIFFRDQTLSPSQLKAFASRFGELDTHTILRGIPGHPEILEVLTEAEDKHVYAEGWHADVTYQPRPTMGAILYAKEVPDLGGDTLFSNQYLAYASLSEAMRKMLDGMTGIHGSSRVYGDRQSEMDLKDKNIMVSKDAARGVVSEHPVVRTHPETGRRSLFVNDHYTLRFKDMTEQESEPLLRFLLAHAIRPEFTCRFRWHKNSIAFWDNRCLLHNPVADYHGQRRSMHRVVVTGDKPKH